MISLSPLGRCYETEPCVSHSIEVVYVFLLREPRTWIREVEVECVEDGPQGWKSMGRVSQHILPNRWEV
jgi:hypothetical protein